MTGIGHLLTTTTVFTGPSRAQLGRLLARPWVKPLAVLLLIVVLEFATFIGNFTGQVAPQWDFYNQYNTEAYAWWRDGSFFSPTQWMPYAWGGYPSLLDVQNSSFYLPVGLMTLFGPFTIHASATLSALHVGFGALGVYVLARSWRVSFGPALLGLVVWFYAAGFYSNASHLDIMRAYAWVPWMLLVIGTTWRWNRWWRWPLAGLILWQGVLSMYPGILVAFAYIGVVYVVASQLIYRPKLRAYLIPLAIAAVASIAMIALRYLPLYLTRGTDSPSTDDTSEFSPELLGTFLFPYDGELPNDVTMRSFFLAAGVFALLPFALWRSKQVRLVSSVVITAALLGLPFWPWHNLARMLPGMGLSRFTMSDYKPFLLLGLALIAIFAAERLIRTPAPELVHEFTAPRAPGRIPWIVAGGILVLFLELGVLAPFDDRGWITQFALLAAAVVAVGVAVSRRVRPSSAVAFIVALSVVSGLGGQLATSVTWVADRPGYERLQLGLPVDTLIAQGDARLAAQGDLAQRPARRAPVPPFDSNAGFSSLWNASFYTREDSIFGYVNIKGATAFETMSLDLFPSTNPSSPLAVAFWGAPGMLIERHSTKLPTVTASVACSIKERCADESTVTPVSYRPGSLTYDVRANDNTRFMANEAYYPGWTARACATGGDCTTLRSRMGAHGEIDLTVPKGDWRVSLDYRLPGLHTAFLAFWGGVAVLLLAAIAVEVVRFVTRRRGRRADQRAA